MNARSQPVLVAGAGIAGLTTALAFARRGRQVRIFEQASRIEAVGAGLQLSPNATRILQKLGVVDLLRPASVRPESVVLKDARSLRVIATVPLGDFAERRWGAPYLVVHRADLQQALLDRCMDEQAIELTMGARISGVKNANAVTISVDGGEHAADGSLLVGADGVWSTIRAVMAGQGAQSRFSGELAWRATIAASSPAGRLFAALGSSVSVTAFLHPGFHLIAYPISGGAAINLVAFTPGRSMARDWSGKADPEALRRTLRHTALAGLAGEAGEWLAWPLHSVDQRQAWTWPAGVALIGDAAHAMTPFAAQGAAMAIEDADTLARFVTNSPDLPGTLAAWERERKPRIARTARRGALNHLAWHAAGPVALARNLFLKTRSPASLAADLDWLYGWRGSE